MIELEWQLVTTRDDKEKLLRLKYNYAIYYSTTCESTMAWSKQDEILLLIINRITA